MQNTIPLKRHPALQHLSHDHHQGLLLCWKIRQGFKFDIQHERMKAYCQWFWTNHLEGHFAEEEKLVFTALDENNQLVKQALRDHRKLKKLFTHWDNPEKTLGMIEEELERHIRFEERILFPLVQQNATPEQLEIIGNHGLNERFQENDTDLFWVK